jgi:Icc-related predicted phosphoesterase
MLRRRQRKATTGRTKIFFATDVHGSERCFRKFLNAGRVYGADVLVLGGDITGKTLIPIERRNGSFSASFRGNAHRDLSEADVAALEQEIYDVGMYPVRGTADELAGLEDPDERERIFVRAVVAQMAKWMELAETRLAGTGIRCLMAPGNDDHWEIDAVIQASSAVEFAEGRCIALDDGTEVVTTGYSNETPWKTPREFPEPELSRHLESMFASVSDPQRLVLVAHPPPRGTDLDQAPAIDGEFRIQMEVGAPKMTSVGSSAVREFIDEHQPLLGLHGHVHESKAIVRLGRTVCINPGSEYTDGVLCAALITVGQDGVAASQLVTG